MPRDEKEQKVLNMFKDERYTTDDIIRYVKGECRDVNFGPQTLGMLFERIAGVEGREDDATSWFSVEIPIDTLANIHPNFRSTNGCQWARSDNSYLGKKYNIIRTHKNGSVYSVKLDGANDKSIKRNRTIRKDIVDAITKQRCAILDVGTQIECDHKDGHYDVLSNMNSETQKVSDFQPLSKAANDAKRGHCIKCINSGKRYDARRLGYSQGYIVGDEDTLGCQGCYWYDPQYFNKIISKDYIKDR